MKKISINYLPHNRSYYFTTIFNQLINIKEENKNVIEVNVFVSYEDDPHINLNLLLDNGIDAQLIYQPHLDGHYMGKVEKAVDISRKYYISLDEEVFMNHYIWDYYIENCSVLDDEQNVWMAPLLSSGIPTVDWFIEQFFDEPEQKELHDMCKNVFLQTTEISSMLGTLPVGLNKFTVDAEKWNYEKFYEGVENNIKHHYRGIHPVRVSAEVQEKIIDLMLNHKKKLLEKQNYELRFVNNRPYFCNSVWMMKTETYRKIVFDRSLFVDAFDEVPMNEYRCKHNLNMVFIDGAFAVHPSYNWIGMERYAELSDKFFGGMGADLHLNEVLLRAGSHFIDIRSLN